jgi:excisionase family DNA binding protein
MRNHGALDEQLLTKGEVAQLCRVEIRTVDRWVAGGKIRGYRTPGGRLLFRKSDVLMAADRSQARAVQGGRRSGSPSGNGSASGHTGPALRR